MIWILLSVFSGNICVCVSVCVSIKSSWKTNMRSMKEKQVSKRADIYYLMCTRCLTYSLSLKSQAPRGVTSLSLLAKSCCLPELPHNLRVMGSSGLLRSELPFLTSLLLPPSCCFLVTSFSSVLL